MHFRQESEILSALQGDAFAHLLDQFQNKERVAFVLEDIGGLSLDRLLLDDSISIGIESFLERAIRITRAVGEVHRQGVIHKDINPSNIVWNRQTDQLKLIDFGLATRLEQEQAAATPALRTRGTLPYISPEQTGRTNRYLDYRTDFYSLGVTFYELLTGHRPFASQEALELIYAHLAKRPTAPHKLRPSTPRQLSRIIMKLMSKVADDRYQSTTGLLIDLQECLRQWQLKGRIDAFELGRQDVGSRLRISQQVYGRQDETEKLRDILDQVGRGGRQLALVSGEPGVGKSALLNQLQACVVESRGWFIQGKFNARTGTLPYAAFSTAFRQLIVNLLSLNEATLSRWRKVLQTALADDAGLVATVILELQILFDDSIPTPDLDLEEARHRFQHAFRRFITAICDTGHRLTIFLDDLQWADKASLQLIHLLLTDEHTDRLLILGAYRDNEVDSQHPLMRTMQELEDADQQVKVISLSPLDRQAVGRMVAHSIYCDVQSAAPLADLVVAKTSGNPFFAEQFLTQLYREKLLWLDFEHNRWRWNEEAIKALSTTVNVADILTRRLTHLTEPTQDLLRYAALLGRRFSIQTLAHVCQYPADAEVYEQLQPAIEAGILIALSEERFNDDQATDSLLMVRTLTFAHDRVQEAASRLFDAQALPAAHLQVARLLEPKIDEEGQGNTLFEVVEHFNHASELIDSPEEALKLARYNLVAAQRALKAQAIAESARLAATAQQWLPDDGWSTDPDLARQIWLTRARTESMTGRQEVAEQLVEEALTRIDDSLSKIDFQTLSIRQLTLAGRYQTAVTTAQQALASMGIALPLDNLDAAIATEMSTLEAKIAGQPIHAIADIPRTDDPRADGALRLLAALESPAAMYDPRLLPLAGLKATSITLDAGIRRGSASGLVYFGLTLASRGQIPRGVEVGELALQLARHFGDEADIAEVAFTYGALLLPWKHHLRQSFSYLTEANEAGLRSGNYLYAGYANAFELIHRFATGEDLTSLQRRALASIEFGQQIRHQAVIDSARGFYLIALNLLGQTHSKTDFSDDIFTSARDYIQHCKKHQNQASVVTFYIARAQVAYIYGDSQFALDQLSAIEDELPVLLGDFDTGRYYFYRALALLQRALEHPGQVDEANIREIDKSRAQLARYAEHCPENFRHKLFLVDAERSRLDGAVVEAMECYRQAIEDAREQEFTHLEALANERTGHFWLARQDDEIARVYLRAARDTYAQWGASRKVEMLHRQFRFLVGLSDAADAWHNNKNADSDSLDVASVFKASEFIVSKLDIDALLPVLLRVTLENAGASHGAFAILEDGQLRVAVEGDADSEPILIEDPIPLKQWTRGPRSILRYVQRTGEPVVLGRAFLDSRFRNDPYIRKHRTRSVLCIPAAEYGEIRGIVYAENNLGDNAFSQERTRVLQILADHIAIALNKARLYATLREEKEHFRQLAENIDEVFWLMDWPSGNITYVSPAYQTIWDRDLPELPLSIEEWVQPVTDEDRPRISQALRERAALGTYDETYQIEQHRRSRRQLRDRGFPIRDEAGNTYRVVGVARDVTSEYESAALKEEFISLVSHELRTPLTPITGIFSMLEYREELPDDLRHLVKMGLRNSRRLRDLINDLLDVHKLSAESMEVNLETLELNSLVAEAIEIEKPNSARRHLSVAIAPHNTPLFVKAGRKRLLQVLAKLLSNAVKFSDPGGTIEVAIDETEGYGQVAITDHGPGIPLESRDEIFEKFTQADSSLTRRHGGTGLGLTIARAIVERFQGRIYFETDESRGTTFFIELPLTDPSIDS